MGDDKETKVIVSADTSKYERAMRDVRAESEKTTSVLKAGWADVRAPMLAVVAAIGAVTYAMSKCVQGSIEAESIQARLGAVLKATGQSAGYNLDQLKGMAEGLAGVTTVSKTAILEGMSMLATFKNIRGEGFEEATKAALDLSTVMQQDLKSSIVQIGKAMNDPIQGMTALRRIGVSFTDEQENQIKTLQKSGDLLGAQALILKELKSEFGGAAVAVRDTFGGALQATQNTFGSLTKEIGYTITQNEAWIQLVKDTEVALKGAIKYIQENKDELKKWADAVAGSLDVALKLAEGIAKIGTAAYSASKYLAAAGMSLQTEVTAPEAALPGGSTGGVTGSWEPDKALGAPTPAPFGGEAGGGAWSPTGYNIEEMKKRMEEFAAAEIEIGYEMDAAEIERENQHYLVLETIRMNHAMNMAETARFDAETRTKLAENTAKQEIEMSLKTAKAKKAAMDMTLDNIIKTGKLMMESSFQGNKTIFEIVKAASIGQAIMSTYTGAANAMRDVPYPFNFLAAASVIAFGMAQVNAIRSQTMESTGGGVSAGVPAVSASTAPVYEPLTIPTELAADKEEKKPIVNIYLEGGLITSPDGVEWLAGIISEAVENADVRLIATSAKSAEALA